MAILRWIERCNGVIWSVELFSNLDKGLKSLSLAGVN